MYTFISFQLFFNISCLPEKKKYRDRWHRYGYIAVYTLLYSLIDLHRNYLDNLIWQIFMSDNKTVYCMSLKIYVHGFESPLWNSTYIKTILVVFPTFSITGLLDYTHVRKFLKKSNKYLLQVINLRLRISFPLDFLNVLLL